MRTFKVAVCFTLLFFVIGVVSAHSVGYNLDSGKTIYKEKVSKSYGGGDYVYSKTIYVYGHDGMKHLKGNYHVGAYSKAKEFENYDDYKEKKYSRSFSEPYWNNQDAYDLWVKHDYYGGKYDYANSWNHHSPSKQFYFKKTGYFGEYEKKECYVSPPKKTLFYTKCPWA